MQRSRNTDEKLKLLSDTQTDHYLWKNLPMPEPKPTEVIEFGIWDALKLLYFLFITIAVVSAIVQRYFYL